MPKIETHSFTHNASDSTIKTDVYFGKMRKNNDYQLRNKKVFFIELSDNVFKYTGFNYVYADTFVEVTKKWEDVMIEFMDSVRSFHKVIAVTMSSIMFDEIAYALGEEKTGEKNYGHNRSGRPRLNVEAYPESSLEMAYHIGYILTIGEKKFWSYYTDENWPTSYSYMPDALDNTAYNRDWTNYKFIDWTLDREVWIRNLYKSFNKVIFQCRSFYNQDEQQIAQIIDRGQGNLLGNG